MATSYYLARLAEAELAHGDEPAASATIREARAFAETHCEYFYLAEIQRLEAVLQVNRQMFTDLDTANHLLNDLMDAYRTAVDQHAKWLALRSVNSMLDTARSPEVVALLGDVLESVPTDCIWPEYRPAVDRLAGVKARVW